jgi:hypothetical protein
MTVRGRHFSEREVFVRDPAMKFSKLRGSVGRFGEIYSVQSPAAASETRSCETEPASTRRIGAIMDAGTSWTLQSLVAGRFERGFESVAGGGERNALLRDRVGEHAAYRSQHGRRHRTLAAHVNFGNLSRVFPAAVEPQTKFL